MQKASHWINWHTSFCLCKLLTSQLFSLQSRWGVPLSLNLNKKWRINKNTFGALLVTTDGCTYSICWAYSNKLVLQIFIKAGCVLCNCSI